MFAEWHHLLKTYHTPIKKPTICAQLKMYLTMDNKIETTAININLCNQYFNFCAAPSQYWLFYHWQNTTIWVLYWALLLREYTVRKYLKSENLYTEKYCCSVFVLLQFFSIALAHFSIHCLLLQNSSHTALNRSWNDQNTIWCLQNDTTFSKPHTHQNQTFPSKPTICAQLKM